MTVVSAALPPRSRHAAPVAAQPPVRWSPPQTELPSIPLQALPVINAPANTVIAHILEAQTPQRVAFLNAHCANQAATTPAYYDALATADLILPDGIGVELGARMKGQRFVANLNGTDFTPALLRAAADRGLSVFLLGGRPGVAERAANRLCHKIPGLRIAGTRDGFDGMRDNAATIARVNASGADILLVALGVPRQDLWLARHAHDLTPKITMGVGALFDFLAGEVARAPRLIRRARSEWIWRLAMEPRRMAKRYLMGNPAYLLRAARDALRSANHTDLARRILDVSGALAGLLALSPLLLLTMAAIRLESRGPVFFRQTRIGKTGTPFTMLKFRSMHIDAEARRAELLASSDRDGVCFKSRHDPRITRVGRIFRRLSIDELPQILNVLRGDMSLVGPRPALPEEVAAYDPRALGRLDIKPGLTGIWQVSGRADIGFDKMIDMDLAYIRSRSLLLDLLLLTLTVRAVFGGRGAY